MADLKPCPFCGRTPTVDDCGDNRYFVRCKCGIAQDKLYYQRCDAVRRWNTRKAVKALAQSEEASVQKMQELEQAEIQKAYELGKLDAMEEMPHWIPCSERLPDDFGEYLVTKKAIGWNCEEYNSNDIAYFDNEGFHKADKVLAWMPLPEPYTERR